jgi:predicted dehydrogenase
MLENLSRYVLDDIPVQPDPEEAVKTLRVLDALARSARAGIAVDISLASD